MAYTNIHGDGTHQLTLQPDQWHYFRVAEVNDRFLQVGDCLQCLILRLYAFQFEYGLSHLIIQVDMSFIYGIQLPLVVNSDPPSPTNYLKEEFPLCARHCGLTITKSELSSAEESSSADGEYYFGVWNPDDPGMQVSVSSVVVQFAVTRSYSHSVVGGVLGVIGKGGNSGWGFGPSCVEFTPFCLSVGTIKAFYSVRVKHTIRL